ncbi:predicted protein [Thalassiosira pseudonana CCMP1335]|uniref:Uncharacterized protein n=1 Tax=Thalassiosira pseudonana TaxID=35128 RepID=B5YN60_THAPS|nr:predicted protein [Thalassiosira pseudonana CCMP1335]ACI64927.1 predicted protein [Thalassiosira pseudonana CCMP1335]
MPLSTTQSAILLCVRFLNVTSGFSFPIEHRHRSPQHLHRHRGRTTNSKQTTQLSTQDNAENDTNNSSYESSASFVKGLVSSLTSVTNYFSLSSQDEPGPSSPSMQQTAIATLLSPPTSPSELLERIRADYAENNYLWTGKLDVSLFSKDCRFTDPTLSFEGIDNYVTNVGNLVPVVEFLLGKEQSSQSKLLDISCNEEEGYVETRWNMIGDLNAIPWSPRIDVIGRTKFWYEATTNEEDKQHQAALQVYFYDEKWEIPAGLALLQFITPAGTIANSNAE